MIDLSPFVIFLPLMFMAVPLLIAVTNGWVVNIDAWPVGSSLWEVKSRNVRRPFQSRH